MTCQPCRAYCLLARPAVVVSGIFLTLAPELRVKGNALLARLRQAAACGKQVRLMDSPMVSLGRPARSIACAPGAPGCIGTVVRQPAKSGNDGALPLRVMHWRIGVSDAEGRSQIRGIRGSACSARCKTHEASGTRRPNGATARVARRSGTRTSMAFVHVSYAQRGIQLYRGLRRAGQTGLGWETGVGSLGPAAVARISCSGTAARGNHGTASLTFCCEVEKIVVFHSCSSAQRVSSTRKTWDLETF